VVEKGMRFLNSGGFLGPLDQVAELLTAGGHIQNTDDDQLFYTRHVPTNPDFFHPGSTTTKKKRKRRGEYNLLSYLFCSQ
jgi:hypothetical protein